MMAAVINFLLLLLIAIYPNSYASRDNYALESFDIDQLRVISIVIHGECKIAYIKGPDEALYIASIGSYVGKNYGMIVEMDKKFITVRELVHAKNGIDWLRREIKMPNELEMK